MEKGQTQSSLQIIKFFEEFIRKAEVVNFVKEYRKVLGLPDNGITFTDEDRQEFEKEIWPILYLPKKIFLLNGKIKKEAGIRIINTCDAFVRQQGVDSIYIPVMLRLFLIFNKTIKIPSKMFGEKDDLLMMEHIPSELSWYDDEDHYLLKCMHRHFDSIARKYPIALYINPEASQNQIKDFISKNWDYIKAYQDETKKILSGIRSKRRQKINDFIYENKELSIAEIGRKLAEEMNEFLDDGHIGKIIQLETKKRN